MNFGFGYINFGNDSLRSGKVRKILKNSDAEPIGYRITEFFSENPFVRRGHFFSFYGQCDIREETRVLVGLCCERQGPSISNYIALETARYIQDTRGCDVRVIIPTYEFLRLGIYDVDDIDEITERTLTVLDGYDFEIVDTLHDFDYTRRRLDKYFQIQRFLGSGLRDPVGDEVVGMQMGGMEIADILISLEGRDTMLISDQGSARPAMGACPIGRKLGYDNLFSAFFYVEPLDISGKGLMYHAPDKRKIYLRPGEEDKIFSAITTGGSRDEFREHGGEPRECFVAEMDSITSDSDASFVENCSRCKAGEFDGCVEHKKIVHGQLKKLLEGFS